MPLPFPNSSPDEAGDDERLIAICKTRTRRDWLNNAREDVVRLSNDQTVKNDGMHAPAGGDFPHLVAHFGNIYADTAKEFSWQISQPFQAPPTGYRFSMRKWRL